MSPVWFFRLSLLLPLALPLVLLLEDSQLSRFMMTSLTFGGAQYAAFAFVLYFWIGRLKEAQRIRRLSYWAPILFIPVQQFPILLFDILIGEDILAGAFLSTIMFAPFVCLYGYGYVGLVNLAYVVFYRR